MAMLNNQMVNEIFYAYEIAVHHPCPTSEHQPAMCRLPVELCHTGASLLPHGSLLRECSEFWQ